MERLPNELFTAIILDISSSQNGWCVTKDIHVLTPFMMVSKRWHNFITFEPLFRNYIALHNCITDERISRQLKLSGNLPLTLKFELPLDRWTAICPKLCDHRKRVQTITFVDAKWSTTHFMKIVPDLSPLPNLKRLGYFFPPIFKMYMYDIKLLFKLFPTINELHNLPISSEDLKLMKEKLISAEVETHDSPTAFLPIAKTMSTIRRVIFTNEMEDESTEDDYAEQFCNSSRQLTWTHLTCGRYNHYPPTSFLYCFPHLTALTLRMNPSTFKDVISITHRFPLLRSFEAHILLDLDVPLSSNLEVLPNPQVGTIQIFIWIPHLPIPHDNVERENLSRKCREIPEIILRAMPEAKYLEISIDGEPVSVPFFSLKELFGGNELFIDFKYSTAIPATDMQLPSSVDSLSIDCNWSVVRLLSSPSLKHLFIRDDFELIDNPALENPYSPIVPAEEHVDLRVWPSLETISLYKSWVRWGEHSLTSLRSVTIWGSEDDSDSVKSADNVTYFVREMARRPHSYPALEDLHFGRCPEWDILLIMLERRNLLTSSNIKRIKKVSLPTLLPHWIYQAIGDLLRCKWPDRPSNRESSMSGNAKIILNSNM
jgi:hypothetical protein